MGRGAFHEFDLRIEPEADDVWRVRVAASPVGAAGPVLFLSSQLSNYIHGQIVNVTGGQFGGLYA